MCTGVRLATPSPSLVFTIETVGTVGTRQFADSGGGGVFVYASIYGGRAVPVQFHSAGDKLKANRPTQNISIKPEKSPFIQFPVRRAGPARGRTASTWQGY